MEENFVERQKRENQKQYQQWKSCGFVGDIQINSYGWCVNGLSLSDHEQTKRIELFNKHPFTAHIEYLRLPNSKYVVGSWLNCPCHGYCHGISVWSKQYETENEAINAELDKIEKSLEPKDRKPFVLGAIQTCRNTFKNSLFEAAFEPTARFEQVALF